MNAWKELEEATKDEEGVRIFDLKKPMTDNILWIGYGEWESMR
jgi:quinol monooxygenase YgiN